MGASFPALLAVDKLLNEAISAALALGNGTGQYLRVRAKSIQETCICRFFDEGLILETLRIVTSVSYAEERIRKIDLFAPASKNHGRCMSLESILLSLQQVPPRPVPFPRASAAPPHRNCLIQQLVNGQESGEASAHRRELLMT